MQSGEFPPTTKRVHMSPAGLRLTRGAIVVAAFVLLSALLAAPVRAQTPSPTATLDVLGVEHRPDTGLVSVRLRANGNRDVRIEQPLILVDNLPSPIVSATTPMSTERPVVLVAVDTSGSMAGARLAAAVSAVRALIGKLATNDIVGLVSFSSSVSTKTPITGGRSSVEAGLAQLSASGDTALYDAVVSSINTLKTAPSGNRILIVLSDGEDSGVSKASRDAAINAVRQADATVYTVGLGNEADLDFLRALSDAGHGAYWSVSGGTSLSDLLATLGGQLGATQTVVISASGLATGSHQMMIRARVAGVLIQAMTSFAVRADLPIAISVGTAANQGDPIPITLTGAPVTGASIDALLDGRRIGVTIDKGRLLVDPWEVAAGDHRLEVQVSVSGVVVARATADVAVPPLAPRLNVSAGEHRRMYVAVGRVQGGQAMLVAASNGSEIRRSASRLEFEAPDGGGKVTVTLHNAEGTAVATEVLDLPPASGTSRLLLYGGSVLLVVAGLVVLRRRRSARAVETPRPVAARSHRVLGAANPVRPPQRPKEAASLIVRDSEGDQRTYVLGPRPLTVGSSPDCDIQISGAEIRPHQATFSAMMSGELRVHGLAKTEGSPLAEQTADLWMVLQIGDEIAIGEWLFRVDEVPRSETASA